MKKNQTAYAIWDSLVLRYQIWALLAWQDLKLRYRRSVIGPFWLTISMAVNIYSIGFLYAKLFKINLDQYFPYLTVGMIAWQFISTIINESCSGFLNAEMFLREIKISPPVFIVRLIYRNILILCHNLPVYLPVVFIFHVHINSNFFFFIPSLLLLVLNAFAYGILLGFLGARFRDIAQIITSIIQVVFFVTPIMWSVSALSPQNAKLVQLNPFAAFVNLLRSPLLGMVPPWYDFAFAAITAFIGFLLLFWVYPKYRARLIYWL